MQIIHLKEKVFFFINYFGENKTPLLFCNQIWCDEYNKYILKFKKMQEIIMCICCILNMIPIYFLCHKSLNPSFKPFFFFKLNNCLMHRIREFITLFRIRKTGLKYQYLRFLSCIIQNKLNAALRHKITG